MLSGRRGNEILQSRLRENGVPRPTMLNRVFTQPRPKADIQPLSVLLGDTSASGHPTTEGPSFVRSQPITFVWHSGMAESQSKKSLEALHAAARRCYHALCILEVSRFGQTEIGVALSAFNRTFVSRTRGREISLKCAFQGSKVFAGGGSCTDLLDQTLLKAKRNSRLASSGHLVSFRFFGMD